MRKIGLYALCLCVTVGLCGCAAGGAVGQVTVKPWEPSALYTDGEIWQAVDVVKAYFSAHFTGCALTELWYAGDEKTANYTDWAVRNEADEVVVLLSTFTVDASGGNGSLNPNSTYNNWNWILVRDTGGRWRHADHGY